MTCDDLYDDAMLGAQNVPIQCPEAFRFLMERTVIINFGQLMQCHQYMWPTYLDFCAQSKTRESVQRRPQKAAVGIYWVWKWHGWDTRALVLVTAWWTYACIPDSETLFQALYFCVSLFFIPVTTLALKRIQSKQKTTKPSIVFDLGVRPLFGVVLESAVCMITKRQFFKWPS